MKPPLIALLLLFHSAVFAQGNLSFGVNYSWMNRIASSTKVQQVISPGFFFHYGNDFSITENWGCYANGGLGWYSGGIAWMELEDLRRTARYNYLRFEVDAGVYLNLGEKWRFDLGLNNSFGARLKAQFVDSEQNLFRNWSPQLETKCFYQKKENGKWAIGMKVATGLRSILYIDINSAVNNIRYETSNDHAAVVFRRYLR